jgi:hypothetical protein
MLTKIETLAGEGHITREDGTSIGIRSYRLTVWQQEPEGARSGTTPTRSIEGYVQLTPHEAYQLVTAAAPLILELEDGRTLPFSFIDHNGQITARGALTDGPSTQPRDPGLLRHPPTETRARTSNPSSMTRDSMADGPRYAEEAFGQALHILIWETGDVAGRLCKMLTCLASLQAAPFPVGSDANARFERLVAGLSASPSGSEGSITSVGSLDEVELASVVSEFLDLYRVLIILNASQDDGIR